MKKNNSLFTVAGLMALMGLLALLALTGCARFETVQHDLSTTNGARTITTEARASTFFSGKSALANWKASQTDKSQGASVGSLSQEATGTETLKALAELLKAAKPTPTP